MVEHTITPYFIPLSAIAKWPANPSPEDHRQWYVPFALFLFLLATGCIAIRYYAVYTKRIRPFGIDDCLIAGGWIMGLVFTITTCYGVQHAGYDRHIWEAIPYGSKPGFIAWFVEMVFLISTTLTKISILLFYRRLLRQTNYRALMHAITFGIVFSVLFMFAFIFFLFGSCRPWKAAWLALDLRYTKPYTCAKRGVADILVGVISVVTDIYTLVIPELLVYSLRMEKRKKIALYVIFGSGILISGAAIARTYWLAQLSYSELRDLTWIGHEAMVWGQVEMQFIFIYACAPALKSYFTNASNATSRTYGTTTTQRSKTSSVFKPASWKGYVAKLKFWNRSEESNSQALSQISVEETIKSEITYTNETQYIPPKHHSVPSQDSTATTSTRTEIPTRPATAASLSRSLSRSSFGTYCSSQPAEHVSLASSMYISGDRAKAYRVLGS